MKMKKLKNNELKWRRLDNSAKIFPISAGKKFSTVFRFSVVLNEKVDSKILQEAVKRALERYKSFKVRMKAGFFWYYFEENTKDPIIEIEKDYPCRYIEPRINNNYLFKVTYYEEKINIDIFHSLTDGNSGSLFFKEIIYTYLELIHPEIFLEEERTIRKIESDTEDSYMKNYNKRLKSNASSKKAFSLKGKYIPLNAISAIHEIINIEDLKKETSKYNCTITQYLSAILINAIYEENYKKAKDNRPIKLCIPVDLRKYFVSKTISNFFSYITLEADMQEVSTFDKIIDFVKNNFKEKLTQEEIEKTMSTNVKLGTNILVRAVPLFVKKILVRLSYIEIRKYTTVTFSNIGRMGIIGKYRDYINYFLMLIAPEPVEKIKCSAVSLENKMTFTFTSILNNSNIEKNFYKFLKDKNINVEIESNGVLDDISSED